VGTTDMPRTNRSAGIVAFRRAAANIELLLIHPGGPFWAKKDAGSWSIPKGLYQTERTRWSRRSESSGRRRASFLSGPSSSSRVQTASRKVISVWAVENDFDVVAFRSNMFSIEWPPKSGRMREFPEADRAQWFSVDQARDKITKGQIRLSTLSPNGSMTRVNPVAKSSSSGRAISFAAAKLRHRILKFSCTFVVARFVRIFVRKALDHDESGSHPCRRRLTVRDGARDATARCKSRRSAAHPINRRRRRFTDALQADRLEIPISKTNYQLSRFHLS